MRTKSTTLFLVLLILPFTVSESVSAQDLQYTTSTRMELEGTAGRVVNFLSRFAGRSDNPGETVYVKGNYMRTDTDGSSTILDLDDARFLFLNHEAKTYAEMKFADMADMAQDAVTQYEEAIEEARQEAQKEADYQAEEMDLDLEYDVKVDRTGETRNIRGHRAERVLMILTAKGSHMVEQEDGQAETLEGSMVLANELWVTNDSNGELAPLFDFQNRMGSSMSDAFSDITSDARMGPTMTTAAGDMSDARMGEMLKKAADEMSEIDGNVLVTVTKFVIVPGNLTFDPKAAFSGEQEEKQEVTATQRAGRLARGLVRNRLGRRSGNDEQAEDPEEDEPRQTTLVTVMTEITDVQQRSLPSSLFEVPTDYQERTLATLHQ